MSKFGDIAIGDALARVESRKRVFCAGAGLYFSVSPDRKIVEIIKTNGQSPEEGGQVLFSHAMDDSVFVSAFLATSQHGVEGWWAFLDHWRGNVNLLKDAASEIAKAIAHMPIIAHPVVGTVYREQRPCFTIVEVIDSPGNPDCEHEGRGPYGNITHTGGNDGAGMIRQCGCGFMSHTEAKMCRHEWVTVSFYLYNMEQKFRCRLCESSMSTGGFALNDPRRTNPAERLDGVA